MGNESSQPELDPVLEVLVERLGPLDGEPVPLEGGITNHNLLVRARGERFVLRIPGRETSLLGISRAAERLAGETAARLGFAPPLVAGDDRYLLTRFIDALPSEPADLRARPQAVAAALRRFHASGVELPVRFWVPDLLESYARVVSERDGRLPAAYAHAQELTGRVAEALPLQEPVPCHNDLLAANLLLVLPQRELAIVDWEYAGMGHPLFDLGNLAVNNDFGPEAEERLLEAYYGAPPAAAQLAALRLMRIMSDAREAAWGVVQSVLSALDFDFPGYAEQHFRRLESAGDDPRLEEWLSAASTSTT